MEDTSRIGVHLLPFPTGIHKKNTNLLPFPARIYKMICISLFLNFIYIFLFSFISFSNKLLCRTSWSKIKMQAEIGALISFSNWNSHFWMCLPWGSQGWCHGGEPPNGVKKWGKCGVLSCIKVTKINFSAIFNKEIYALEGRLSQFQHLKGISFRGLCPLIPTKGFCPLDPGIASLPLTIYPVTTPVGGSELICIYSCCGCQGCKTNILQRKQSHFSWFFPGGKNSPLLVDPKQISVVLKSGKEKKKRSSAHFHAFLPFHF